jgi:hypothetical protein
VAPAKKRKTRQVDDVPVGRAALGASAARKPGATAAKRGLAGRDGADTGQVPAARRRKKGSRY